MRGVVYACVYSVSICGVVNAGMHVSVFCRVRGMLGVMFCGVQCTHCAAYTWCPACMARCMRGRVSVLCSVRVVRWSGVLYVLRSVRVQTCAVYVFVVCNRCMRGLGFYARCGA